MIQWHRRGSFDRSVAVSFWSRNFDDGSRICMWGAVLVMDFVFSPFSRSEALVLHC